LCRHHFLQNNQGQTLGVFYGYNTTLFDFITYITIIFCQKKKFQILAKNPSGFFKIMVFFTSLLESTKSQGQTLAIF